jgi:hypothetical protein
MLPSATGSEPWPVVPVDGVVVVGVIGDSVWVDVAAIGVVVAVGTTAGVLDSGELVTEKAPVVADEVLEGRDAGTTVPVWVDVLHRPWHTVEVELRVELPVTAGRPFTVVVVAPAWAVVPVVPEPVVVGVVGVAGVVAVVDVVVVLEVVVVPVVVGLVVV